jgi:hypothetical protein
MTGSSHATPTTFASASLWRRAPLRRFRLPASRASLACLVGAVALGACQRTPDELATTVTRFCVDCHNDAEREGELTLQSLDLADVAAKPEVWEKVARKLSTGTMPPSDQPQPSGEQRSALVAWLETNLDAGAAQHPNPGRTETFRRLNRTEYRNAIRDLLAVEIDVAALLPPDESGYGFDNVNVGDLSPALLDRYIAAAQKISRLAVGGTQASLQSNVISMPADATQEEHVAGLPPGTRGGVLASHTFPQDGEYELQVHLARNRNANIGGLRGVDAHTLHLLIDRRPVATFVIEPPPDGDDTLTDSALIARVPVTAGPHAVAATFVKNASSLIETERQPLAAHFNEQRHPRLTPAIEQLSITGPYVAQGVSDTPSRRRLFVCTPPASGGAELEDACAEEIVSTLLRRAYRRPVTRDDVAGPMAFYKEGRSQGGFAAGIEQAVTAALVNPAFLFRVERDPADAAQGSPYRISDLELASRLSFFLWSSIPDDELLDMAIRGELGRPGEIERQARRMLADPRSSNLASNFAGQWLLLRNLDSVSPDPRQYPDFDDNLRQAFRQETELLFDSVLREDRSVLDLLTPDYTFLNERLAKHYGIPGVYGSRWRRVDLEPSSQRGGLLRQGSILAVTSYATRTSPVIRGKWVLGNLYGAPPPEPPVDVPALEDNSIKAELSMRERLREHRTNTVCAGCHNTIDPVGFALENFDAVGRWRDRDGDNGRMDASGALPGVGQFDGVDGLEAALLTRPDLFAGRVTEQLLTFALGRGVDYYDAPAIRKILRETEPDGYRFSSLIVGITTSVPFQMRNAK